MLKKADLSPDKKTTKIAIKKITISKNFFKDI